MYNTKKVCIKCGWKMLYDSNKDPKNISEFKFCPICKKELLNRHYSPNL